MRSAFVKIIEWLRPVAIVLFNPKLLLCFGIAWLFTNGWCYIAIVLGSCLGITWLTIAGTAYAGFLWLPFTPEKIVTFLLAIFLLRLLFPNDTKTLRFLKDKLSKLKDKRKYKSKKKKTEAE